MSEYYTKGSETWLINRYDNHRINPEMETILWLEKISNELRDISQSLMALERDEQDSLERIDGRWLFRHETSPDKVNELQHMGWRVVKIMNDPDHEIVYVMRSAWRE